LIQQLEGAHDSRCAQPGRVRSHNDNFPGSPPEKRLKSEREPLAQVVSYLDAHAPARAQVEGLCKLPGGAGPAGYEHVFPASARGADHGHRIADAGEVYRGSLSAGQSSAEARLDAAGPRGLGKNGDDS
jgi:hypothetical protein